MLRFPSLHVGTVAHGLYRPSDSRADA